MTIKQLGVSTSVLARLRSLKAVPSSGSPRQKTHGLFRSVAPAMTIGSTAAFTLLAILGA